ncbi:MAG: hypothetical protein GY765_03485, partial [bacterium]|nr:hypothetical protein [bacterium]
MRNKIITHICICLMLILTVTACKSVTQPEEIKAPVYPTEPTIASFQPPYSTECFEETVFAVDGDTGF